MFSIATLAALQTLLKIAQAEAEQLPALVAELEQQAAQYVLLVQNNLQEAPAIIITRLVERYPELGTLQAHPQATLVMQRITKILKARSKR